MNRSKLLVIAFATLVIGGATAQARPPNPQLLTLTESGVAGLRLGRTLAEVRRTGGSGRPAPAASSCRPGRSSPPASGAARGFATFGGAAPHRLVALDVRGGAQTVRHLAVGASSAAVKRAYPGARLLTSRPSDPLQLTA